MYFDSHAHLGEDCFAQDFVNIVEKCAQRTSPA